MKKWQIVKWEDEEETAVYLVRDQEIVGELFMTVMEAVDIVNALNVSLADFNFEME